jgi:DNA-binding NarL/FixJ family response regulator
VTSLAHNCVLLADRHHGLVEGIRGLLETTFYAVVMVADQSSLFETVGRLGPEFAIVDLSLFPGDNLRWLEKLRAQCPDMMLIVISVYDEPNVRARVLAVGADAYVLKRNIADELLPVIDKLLARKKLGYYDI